MMLTMLMLCNTTVVHYYSQCTIKLTDIQHPDELYETLHPYYFAVAWTVIIFMATLQLVCACRFVSTDQVQETLQHWSNWWTSSQTHLPGTEVCLEAQVSWESQCIHLLGGGHSSTHWSWLKQVWWSIHHWRSRGCQDILQHPSTSLVAVWVPPLSSQWLSCTATNGKTVPWSLDYSFFSDPMLLVSLTNIIRVPVYQLIRKCCLKHHSHMLKRIGLGLVCCLLKEVLWLSFNQQLKACSTFWCSWLHWNLSVLRLPFDWKDY